MPNFAPEIKNHITQLIYIDMNKSPYQLRYSLLLISVFAFALTSAQQALKLTSIVTDKADGAPLSHARVEVRSAEGNALAGGALTGADGKATIQLGKAGRYTVSVSLLGYRKHSGTVDLKSSETMAIKMAVDEKALGEVVVDGLSPTEKVARLAYNVSLIETDKFKNTTMDLASVMDRISGVRIRQGGGVGSDADVSLNGFSGRHVKVFIDGVPMEGMSSAFGLNNIPAGLAKRIEVYKGVVPIELGGDALGGAINIVTDKSRRTRVNASYSFGSFNTHKTNVYAEYTAKNGFHVSLNAYQNYSDNDYKVNIDHYTDFTNNSVVYGDFEVRRFHARYHNEAAVLKVGVVDKPFADRLLLGFTGGYEYKETQNASNMNWVYGARYTTASTLMPTLTYEKRFDVLEGLHVSLNGNYNFGKSYAADTASCNYNWLGERGPGRTVVHKIPLPRPQRRGQPGRSAVSGPGPLCVCKLNTDHLLAVGQG